MKSRIYLVSRKKSTATMASYVGNSFGDQDVDKLVSNFNDLDGHNRSFLHETSAKTEEGLDTPG